MKARENPFATDRVQSVRYRPCDGCWDALLERLAGLDYRAAVVGPKGTGKTTLLRDLQPKLAALGFKPKPLRLDVQQPCFPALFEREFFGALDQRDIILLDGAEQMSRWRWWRFRQRCRRARGLIITSHRPGLLPTLLETRTTPELLEEIVVELLSRDTGVIRAQASLLFLRHAGNLREALRELYDLAAQEGS